MNSISRNKYIDKSATPLKAYFTLASVRERAQTTYARLRTYVPMYIHTRTRTNDGADVAVRGKKRRRRSESGKEGEERERERRERAGCTYRRVVCSVYKESCLFLADGYRRKTICLGDLECFVNLLANPLRPSPLSSPFLSLLSPYSFLPSCGISRGE